ncbi:MAG: glutamate synthase small subunit [Gammaproteobacteria bacterium]|nr:glutamate synthase small subunit [Gammaproteobacteria bacterium]
MSERHPDGFLKHKRQPIGNRPVIERSTDYREIYLPKWDQTHLQAQGERCMDCGVPTCMGGCPIGNSIPDWNDLIYRGDWRAALEQLHATNNFPEFTGYTCPAPCEPACVLACNDEPVTIKSIERAIVDRGWQEGWIRPQPPEKRSGFQVAIVGSGPAGLAAAQQLNRAGHRVTVYERENRAGGLMTYGIPDFKIAKHQVERRIEQLSAEGIVFETGVEIGKGRTLADLRFQYDAVCLAIGAQKPRNVRVMGRDLAGVHFAMDYLVQENCRQHGEVVTCPISAKGKRVVVLGGGDTGADCVATAHRQGARYVLQININPQLPDERTPANPWPEYSQTYVASYAIEEGGEEVYSMDIIAFEDNKGNGHVDSIVAERVAWRYDEEGKRVGRHVLETKRAIAADLVLVAIGFQGPRSETLKADGLELTARGTITTNANMMTVLPGVFAAGDAQMGPSIVVWAIGEGRDVARQIDIFLSGGSRLPASLRTSNPYISRAKRPYRKQV